jgi:hypothetical protein
MVQMEEDMSELAAPPGPWEYIATSGYDYGSRSYWIPKVCIAIDTEETARLLAAAPDLLEALEACRGQWIHSVNAERCLSAIAKATGDAQ